MTNSLQLSFEHLAAAARSRQLSSYALTEELLLLADEDRKTVAHIATEYGCFGQIPAALINEQLLTQPDNSGRAVVHILAVRGELDKVPKTLMTAALLRVTWRGFNVAHLTAKSGNLDQIPNHLITAELISLKDKTSQELTLAVHAGRRQLRTLLGRLVIDRDPRLV